MKPLNEKLLKMLTENPEAEILFMVSGDAPYSDIGDYSVMGEECIHINLETVCWLEAHGDKNLISRDDVLDDSLVDDKYFELVEERGIDSREDIDEIWKEAEEIVSRYKWFEAILVYVEGH